jgi:hypothetical protein
MAHRLALGAASIAAVAVLTTALAAAGFAPGAPAQPVATNEPIAAVVAPEPTVQVDNVYVAAPAKQKTITVHRVVKASGGEDDAGGDD